MTISRKSTNNFFYQLMLLNDDNIQKIYQLLLLPASVIK